MPIVINLKDRAYKKDENENLDNSVKITIQIKNELYNFRIEHEELFKSRRVAVLTEFCNNFRRCISDLTNHHLVFDCYPDECVYDVMFNKYRATNEIEKLVMISRKPDNIDSDIWKNIIFDAIDEMESYDMIMAGIIEFYN